MPAKRKYPWEAWFSQRTTKLMRGMDYNCAQAVMWQIVRNNAYSRGLRGRVRITDTHDGILIEVLGEIPHPDEIAVTS